MPQPSQQIPASQDLKNTTRNPSYPKVPRDRPLTRDSFGARYLSPSPLVLWPCQPPARPQGLDFPPFLRALADNSIRPSFSRPGQAPRKKFSCRFPQWISFGEFAGETLFPIGLEAPCPPGRRLPRLFLVPLCRHTQQEVTELS